jgi:hypothetical protein
MAGKKSNITWLKEQLWSLLKKMEFALKTALKTALSTDMSIFKDLHEAVHDKGQNQPFY